MLCPATPAQANEGQEGSSEPRGTRKHALIDRAASGGVTRSLPGWQPHPLGHGSGERKINHPTSKGTRISGGEAYNEAKTNARRSSKKQQRERGTPPMPAHFQGWRSTKQDSTGSLFYFNLIISRSYVMPNTWCESRKESGLVWKNQANRTLIGKKITKKLMEKWMILWILLIFIGETRLTDDWGRLSHDLQWCVETLLRE